jgi:Pyruvate/2-oxoacid:ferredoxin oxidoreductase gamma subunit
LSAHQEKELESVTIRFAGDSGDGMQLTGDQFTDTSAIMGNDIATLPDFPAEIRAPAGTLAGVSAFQLHFADPDIMTPGDAPNVLVAMNPAALKANLKDLPRGADIIVNTDEFTHRNLEKVGYRTNPLDDDTLASYSVHPIALTSQTVIQVTIVDTGVPEVPGRKRISLGYRFSPTSLTFASPATIYLPWVHDRVPVAVDPSEPSSPDPPASPTTNPPVPPVALTTHWGSRQKREALVCTKSCEPPAGLSGCSAASRTT